MKLEDVEEKLRSLRFKKKEFLQEGIFRFLVEAITEYTLTEPPRFWYLLEIPEPSTSSTGGWRKIVEIMKKRGCQAEVPTDDEILVNSLAEAYTFNAYSKFRKIVTALMIKVSREAGILHYWHRILYVSAKQILDKDLSEDFDAQWDEKLELDESFKEMSAVRPATDVESMGGMETLLENVVVDQQQQQQQQLNAKGVKRRRKNLRTKIKRRGRVRPPIDLEPTITLINENDQFEDHELPWQVQTKIEPRSVSMPSVTMQTSIMPNEPICKFEPLCSSETMDVIDNTNLGPYGVIFV